MNSPQLRVFLTTSHACTVYATMLVKHTRSENCRDVLLLDASARRKGLVEVILETAKLYDWALVHDFSIVHDESLDYKPTRRKKIMRRIKTWPVIKNIYDFLLERHRKKEDRAYIGKLKDVLHPFLAAETKVELFVLTQSGLNRQLFQLFPDAGINYIEHGVIDYFMVLEPEIKKGNFYGVFADRYRHFLEKRGHSTEWVKQIPGVDGFQQLTHELLLLLKAKLGFSGDVQTDKRCVFVALEALEMYYVPPTFWGDYMERIFAHIEQPASYHYLLKPHPMQSKESLDATVRHFRKKGYSFTVLNESNINNICTEVLFDLYANKVDYLFCLFSAACFYASKLYGDKNIKYRYSLDFMNRFAEKAPPQIRRAYLKTIPLIEEVFVENCKEY